MDENKKKIPNTTVTRNTALFSDMTDNIYETVAVLTKRANQIAVEEKKELHKKIEEFNTNDAIDEYYAFENDFPESKYLKEAKSIFQHAESIVKRKKLNLNGEED